MAKLFVDSGANLTPKQREQYGIGLISILTTLRNVSYRDDEITAAQIVEAQRHGVTVLTSTPSLGEVGETVGKAISEGHKEIIILTIPAHSSKTFDVISQAADELMAEHEGVRIVVIDSYNVSMTQGFLALKVAELLKQRASFDNAVDYACDHRWNGVLLVALATPAFAGTGGRVPALKAKIGSMIKLRPTVVVLPNQKPRTFGSSMTRSSAAALDRIAGTAGALWRLGARIAVVYAPDADERENRLVKEKAKSLVATLHAKLKIEESVEIPMVEGAAPLLVHSGYGALAIAIAFNERFKWVEPKSGLRLPHPPHVRT